MLFCIAVEITKISKQTDKNGVNNNTWLRSALEVTKNEFFISANVTGTSESLDSSYGTIP